MNPRNIAAWCMTGAVWLIVAAQIALMRDDPDDGGHEPAPLPPIEPESSAPPRAPAPRLEPEVRDAIEMERPARTERAGLPIAAPPTFQSEERCHQLT